MGVDRVTAACRGCYFVTGACGASPAEIGPASPDNDSASIVTGAYRRLPGESARLRRADLAYFGVGSNL